MSDAKFCPICEREFHRGENELQQNFKKRKTCSPICRDKYLEIVKSGTCDSYRCVTCGENMNTNRLNANCKKCEEKQKEANERRQNRFRCADFSQDSTVCVINRDRCTCPALSCFKGVL